ncbi:putative hemoglobin and hemoglobin-haptoglobin-binding protein 3 [Pandoraea anhela]|uniref:Putative hemoglobin and hemoglobin-haptoglobin-binding protein 3 n=2 Tax=Pandoraea anhela TaxID=2508295 RepID=A0A5E4Z9A2_9BURK|nr:putative hemoglobin and hemoglobin-haptoglobin-binding protein 3 [Pandoraea anhela]
MTAPIYHRRDWVASGLTLLIALVAMVGPSLRSLMAPPVPKPPEVLTEIDLAPPQPKPTPETKPEPKPAPRQEHKPAPTPRPSPEPHPAPRPMSTQAPAPAAQPVAPAAPVTSNAAPTASANPTPAAPVADAKPAPRAATANKGDPDHDYERALRTLVESRKKYPTNRQAMIEKPTGTVALCVTLDRGGRVKDVNVTNSSGSLLLDNTATHLVEGTTYPPFQDSHFAGQAQHAFCMKIDYQLPGNS